MRTKGRYYFAPDNVQMVSGYHYLGSRTWLDGNAVLVQGLGEDLKAPHKWFPGTQPAELPEQRIVGDAVCISGGETITDLTPVQDLIDGFPSACFVPLSVDAWPYVATVTRCSLQRFYARLIEWLYNDDAAAIETAFRLLLGSGIVVRTHPQQGIFPAVATCVIDDIMVVVIDGTRNFQQLALQGMYSIQRPFNYGILGTNPIWYAASSYVLGVIQADGLVPGMRVMLAGHSYGACAALIVGARLDWWGAMGEVRYITYGCPKPGDFALHVLTADLVGINLANDNDSITIFPPDGDTMDAVLTALLAPQLRVWFDWVRPGNQLLQLDDGTTIPNNFPFLDFFTLYAIAGNALGGNFPAPFVGHQIQTYYARIDLRCGGAEWPVNKPLSDFMDQSTLGLTGPQISSGKIGLHAHLVPVVPSDGGKLGLIRDVLEDEIMIGQIIYFAADTVPVGFLECDGSAVSRTTYAVLFGVVGTTWGIGDGSTTFNLPDLRDRVCIGKSPGGLGSDRPTVRNLGDVGGEETHTLVKAEIPNHAHTIFDTDVTSGPGGMPYAGANVVLCGNNNNNTNNSGAFGGGGAHNNMEPFATVKALIKY